MFGIIYLSGFILCLFYVLNYNKKEITKYRNDKKLDGEDFINCCVTALAFAFIWPLTMLFVFLIIPYYERLYKLIKGDYNNLFSNPLILLAPFQIVTIEFSSDKKETINED